METTFIDYEVEGRIATITLNRAEAANAQTLPMLDDLDEAWRRAAEDDEVRVIILQGNGKHFSAGHDLKGVGRLASTRPSRGVSWSTRCAGATSQSRRSPRCRASASQAGSCWLGRVT
jgi:enoyl-CoA hydratase